MKKIVILGSGAGGTICANKLRKELSPSEWQISIIDNDEMHHYQPGWLFIPFGIYTAEDCMKPKRDFIPKGVNFIFDEVVGVNPDAREVECKKKKYKYDWLIIATGCRIAANEFRESLNADRRLRMFLRDRPSSFPNGNPTVVKCWMNNWLWDGTSW